MKICEEDLNLREIEKSDIPTIVALEKELFSDPWTAEVFMEELENRSIFTKKVSGEEKSCKDLYLLEYKSRVIGFFLGWDILGDYTIMNIGVAKEFQGQGLGSFLLSKMIEMAIDLESLALYLEVRISNIAAHRLYSRFGFHEIGRRKNYYSHPQEDAIVMKLDLDVNEEMMDKLLSDIL